MTLPLSKLPDRLTVREAAEVLGVSTQRVHQLRLAGKLTAARPDANGNATLTRASVERRRARLLTTPRRGL